MQASIEEAAKTTTLPAAIKRDGVDELLFALLREAPTTADTHESGLPKPQ